MNIFINSQMTAMSMDFDEDGLIVYLSELGVKIKLSLRKDGDILTIMDQGSLKSHELFSFLANLTNPEKNFPTYNANRKWQIVQK
jgi:hypothetical protein